MPLVFFLTAEFVDHLRGLIWANLAGPSLALMISKKLGRVRTYPALEYYTQKVSPTYPYTNDNEQYLR